MRLIQQFPAWTLHAYLRILGVAYRTENSVAALKAMGLPLPVIVDCDGKHTELLALDHLTRRYSGSATEMTTEAVFSAYLRQSLVVPFTQLKKLSKYEEAVLLNTLPFGYDAAVNITFGLKALFDDGRYPTALPSIHARVHSQFFFVIATDTMLCSERVKQSSLNNCDASMKS
jgi:hypothetical protein